MHENVANVPTLDGVSSAGSMSSPNSNKSLAGRSKAPIEDAQLDEAHERLVIIYGELRLKLVRMVQARIHSSLQGRIGVDDVLQGALLRLIEDLRSKRPASDEQLSSWLYKKVWSQLQDEIRKHNAGGRAVTREHPLPGESVVEVVGRLGVSTSMGLKDVIALIQQALEPDEFEVVRLRIVDELSYGDIAEIFDTTTEAIRKRYVRTLLKVRKTISDPFASSEPARG